MLGDVKPDFLGALMLLPGDMAELSGVNLLDASDWLALWSSVCAAVGPFSDIRHVCKSWKSSESSRDGVVLKHVPPPPILWHFPIKRRGCAPPLESGLSACLTQTTAEFCSASLQKLYQFLGPGLKKRVVSTSCLLGHSLLESSYRAVKKPKWPCGKTQAQERSASTPSIALWMSHPGRRVSSSGTAAPADSALCGADTAILMEPCPNGSFVSKINDCCVKPPSFVARTRRGT